MKLIEEMKTSNSNILYKNFEFEVFGTICLIGWRNIGKTSSWYFSSMECDLIFNAIVYYLVE